MNSTLKHIGIFVTFMLALLLWHDAKPYIADLFSRSYRETLTLWLWSSMVVVIFHLLFYYLSKYSERIIFIIAAISVVVILFYTGVIEV